MASLFCVVGAGLFGITITAYFGASSKSVWPGSILSIAQVALGPPMTQAADYWGRKWFLVTTTVAGFVGSIVVSRAENVSIVLLGFGILSVGYSSQPLLHAVASEAIPRRLRPIAQASLIFAGCMGSIIGLLMGGQLLRGHLENFRVYFYVLAGIYAVATLGCLTCYNPLTRELQTIPFKDKVRALDWIGYLLFSPGLTLFCVALSWAKNPYPWTNVRILAPLIIGLVTIVAFIVYEWRFKKDGIFHHDLLRDRNFPLSLIAIFVEGFTFFTINVYVGYQFALFTGSDKLLSMVPMTVTMTCCLVFNLLFGAYATRMKSLRWPIFVAFVLILLYSILMTTTTPGTSKASLLGYPAFAGAGYGVVVPLLVVAGQFSTPPELISLTSGLLIVVRAVGDTVSLAVNNAVFAGALSTHLAPKVSAAVLPLGLPPSSLGMFIGALSASNAKLLGQVPGVTPEIIGAGVAALKEAYSIGFRNVWIVAVAFTAVACAGTLLRTLVGHDGTKWTLTLCTSMFLPL